MEGICSEICSSVLDRNPICEAPVTFLGSVFCNRKTAVICTLWYSVRPWSSIHAGSPFYISLSVQSCFLNLFDQNPHLFFPPRLGHCFHLEDEGQVNIMSSLWFIVSIVTAYLHEASFFSNLRISTWSKTHNKLIFLIKEKYLYLKFMEASWL